MSINNKKLIPLLIAGFLWAGKIGAQEVVDAAGGDATGSGGSVAYSIGQVMYTTNIDSSGIAAQGVQHAYEVFIVEESVVDGSITVFPNPALDHLILQISDYNKERLFVQLIDMHGKLLIEEQIKTKQTKINMYGLAVATYIVHVVNRQYKSVKSFRIIKYKKL